MNFVFYVPKVLVMCGGQATTIACDCGGLMVPRATNRKCDDGFWLTWSQFSKSRIKCQSDPVKIQNMFHVSSIEHFNELRAINVIWIFYYYFAMKCDQTTDEHYRKRSSFNAVHRIIVRYKNVFINIASNDLFAFLSHIFLSFIRFSCCKDATRLVMMIWWDEIASAF